MSKSVRDSRRRTREKTESILIFRLGSLGDTLVSVPAMWAVRNHFPDAEITFLCDQQIGKQYVSAKSILAGCRAIDDFLAYPVGGTSVMRMLGLGRLVFELRLRRYDVLVYLAPTGRTLKQIARDRRFFRMAGIKRFVGMSNFPEYPKKVPGLPLAPLPPEADLLLDRLAADGIRVPAPGAGKMELNLGDAEQREIASWLATLPSDDARPWIGVGPGSKMPAKIWPRARYGAVVQELVNRFRVWPVIFGGPEDREIGRELIRTWGVGYNAAGTLSLRGSIAALARCRLYVGNDTGTMHMAAANGTPCVAVFSSRDVPGIWYPYGAGHKVLRTSIECEGCLLDECVQQQMRCIRGIEISEVVVACCSILEHRPFPLILGKQPMER